MTISFGTLDEEAVVSVEAGLSRTARRVLRTVYEQVGERADRLHVYFQLAGNSGSIGVVYEIDGRILEFHELSTLTPPLKDVDTTRNGLADLAGRLGMGLEEMIQQFRSSGNMSPSDVWMSIDLPTEKIIVEFGYQDRESVSDASTSAAVNAWKKKLSDKSSRVNGSDSLFTPLDLS